jgi:hypothetical protein
VSSHAGVVFSRWRVLWEWGLGAGSWCISEQDSWTGQLTTCFTKFGGGLWRSSKTPVCRVAPSQTRKEPVRGAGLKQSEQISCVATAPPAWLGVWPQSLTFAKQEFYHLSQTSSPLLWFFGDGVSRTICLSWPQTSTLPISAFQVDRITGVNLSAWLTWVIYMKKVQEVPRLKLLGDTLYVLDWVAYAG